MDTKTRSLYILPTRDPPTYRLKVKGWKKIFHANRDQKKAGVVILISDKTDFKTKMVYLVFKRRRFKKVLLVCCLYIHIYVYFHLERVEELAPNY